MKDAGSGVAQGLGILPLSLLLSHESNDPRNHPEGCGWASSQEGPRPAAGLVCALCMTISEMNWVWPALRVHPEQDGEGAFVESAQGVRGFVYSADNRIRRLVFSSGHQMCQQKMLPLPSISITTGKELWFYFQIRKKSLITQSVRLCDVTVRPLRHCGQAP